MTELKHVRDAVHMEEQSLTRPLGFIDWAAIPGKGRGVIARVACAAGTEIERSPVIIVPEADLLDRDDPLTVEDQYLMYWSDEPGRELAMGAGLLMFYNHSDTPNVELEEGPEPLTMSVFALRDIAPGEELMYDYGVPLWFEQSPSAEPQG